MRHLFKPSLFILLLLCSTLVRAQLEPVKSYYENLGEQATLSYITGDGGRLANGQQVLTIVLMRHGEPALDKTGWRKRKEAQRFVMAYDSVGIYPPAFVPMKLRASEVPVIHTSSIPRSRSTAQQIFPNQLSIQQPDSLFREFERKIFSFPNIKLPLKWWLTGSRVMWFMGLNKKGIESFSKAKARAKQATAVLQQDAEQHGKTLLVSHGLLNHYLVKYLEKEGWTMVYDGGSDYLAQKVLVKHVP